jgi:Adenylate and Guanylate cyclase catalytic domain
MVYNFAHVKSNHRFYSVIICFFLRISSRTPCQVFTLLEVLYGAFDKIAHRRKVFKVETIGDCYVAATGLVCWFDLMKCSDML